MILKHKSCTVQIEWILNLLCFIKYFVPTLSLHKHKLDKNMTFSEYKWLKLVFFYTKSFLKCLRSSRDSSNMLSIRHVCDDERFWWVEGVWVWKSPEEPEISQSKQRLSLQQPETQRTLHSQRCSTVIAESNHFITKHVLRVQKLSLCDEAY